ncbi:MFS general substrate transporter [Aspergillus steynii IBT 23096]|uniref:MFS general substrate transporter n=1 Tax=Aspergillus steynii IBT 23096 TaxID=1392250 RepID=A0A2I2GIC5_9EURO|nr:MFS general substrate transporter [Aspergillus steynii IBT 23096]PLB52629.1 MFS general substrate transporter [Aspergillus steynii IBT 23096]
MVLRNFYHEKLGGLASRRPICLEWRSHKVFILFVVAFAMFTDMLLYGLIVPVIPTVLTQRVGLSVAEEQGWTSILLALYGSTLLAFCPISGYIADRIQSRRWPLLVGLVIMGASTAMLCVGSNLALWITGRLFQGASAAVVWTVGMALLADNVESDELGGAMGLASSGMTLGVMVGPLLGGVLYEHAGYYAVFGLAFGFIGLDIFFRLVLIEKKDAAKWLKAENESESDSDTEPQMSRLPADPIDSSERGLSAHSTQETEASPDSPCRQEFSTDTSSTCTANSPDHNDPTASIHSKSEDARSRNHRISRSNTAAASTNNNTGSGGRLLILLKSRRLAVALFAYFIQATCIMCFDSVLPLFVHDTFGWGQSGQGLIFIPLSLPHIGDPLTGFIVDRWPRCRIWLAAGAFLTAVPLLTCLRFVTENTLSDKAVLCALLALIGIMGGILEPPLMVEITYIIEQKEAEYPHVFGKGGGLALGYGVMNAAWAAGSLIGPIYGGFIRDNAGWGTTTWALAVLMGAPGILLLFLLRE